MLKEMWFKVVLGIVSFATTGACGYLSAKVKEYHKKIKDKEANENVQNIALLTLLQSQLTNTYFVYNELKQIPDYIYKNWLNLLAVYEQLGGDDYVHTLAHKMESWEITKTDIL